MDKITEHINCNRFIPIDSEELTALELIGKTVSKTNELVQKSNELETLANENKNKKVSYDELHNKYQLTAEKGQANFNGSWQGLNKPTLSDEGMRATVEKINEVDIPNINEQLADIVKKAQISVTDFGCVGDGIIDDYLNITTTIQYCLENKKDILFPSGYTFKSTETIYIPVGVNVEMNSPIVFHNNGDGIVIGEPNKTVINGRFLLNVTRNSATDWEGERVGIKLYNINTSFVDVINSTNFDIGIMCIGDGGGYAYSKMTIGTIFRNRIGLKLYACNNGWCNENSFYDGRYGGTSSLHPTKDRIGVLITSTGYINNNNVFYKPSFEMGKKDGETYSVLIENGAYNTIYDCRNEGSPVKGFKVVNGGSNYLSSGYGVIELIDETDIKDNIVENVRKRNLKYYNTTIFNTGKIIDNVCEYDGTSSKLNISNLSYVYATGGHRDREFITNGSVENDYLVLNSSIAIGTYLDTTEKNSFILYKNCVDGFGGRVKIICFDEFGEVIGDNLTKLIFNSTQHTLFHSSSFGGAYSTGGDTNEELFFTVDKRVKKIFIGLSGGTNSLKVKSFTIKAINSTYTENIHDGLTHKGIYNIASSIPTSTNYKKGKIVLDSTFSTKGWRFDGVSWEVLS